MIRPRRLLAAAALGVATLSLAACGAGTTTPTPAEAAPTAATTEETLEGSITIFAAASLKATFTELAEEFEAEHPGTQVDLSFAGSSDLVTQITEGAPADVFASADAANMAKLVDAGLVDGAPQDFATNVLTIAVPPGNPAGIASYADLSQPDLRLVVCAPQVPCGAAAVRIEEATGVALAPVSEESSVTDVLGKVTSGEADAGLVYVTDVLAAGDAVEGVDFPEAGEAVNTYPIATVAGGSSPEIAAAFIALVLGEQGRAVLAAAGFGAP